MTRTSEQVAADDALTAAIEGVLVANDILDSGEMVLEYAVVAATQKMIEDGDVSNSYVLVVRDGKVASTRVCGLLDTASFDIKMGDRQ